MKGANKVVKLPHVPGHELAGLVLEAGPDCRRFAAGDRVTVPVILGCGHCPHCRAGKLTVCDALLVAPSLQAPFEAYTHPAAFTRAGIPPEVLHLRTLPKKRLIAAPGVPVPAFGLV